MQVNVDPKRELFRWGPAPLKIGANQYWFVPFCLQLSKYYGGLKWPEGLFLTKGGRLQLFINELDPLRALGRKMFYRIIRPPVVRREAWKRWQKARDALMVFQSTITSASLRRLADYEFRTRFAKWQELYQNFWTVSAPPELSTWGLEGMIRKRLEALRLAPDEFRAAFELLTSPTRYSFFNEERIDLLRISLKYKGRALERALLKHQQEYFWLHNSYADTFVLPVSFFRRELRKLPESVAERREELHVVLSRGRSIERKKKRMMDRLQLPKEARNEIELLAYCIWWQDHRKKYAWIANHYLDLFLKQAGRRLKVDWLDFKEVWGHEVGELLENPEAFDLKARVNAYRNSVVMFKNEHMEHITDKKRVRALFDKYWAPPVRAVREIAGLVVSRGAGPVRGRVRVLLDSKETAKMKKGEILIAGMTSPDFVVAMKRAVAIVTDAGGMTSHAAVVSRELGIPCLVGTKVATQVFKDGDNVEVDTERGIVRKI